MPEDSYSPGRGRAIKQQKDEEELDKVEITLKKAKIPSEVDLDDGYSIIEDGISSDNRTPNWAIDTKKAIDIMNDDKEPLPGGFGYIPDTEKEESDAAQEINKLSNTEKLKQFELTENSLMKVQAQDRCNQKLGTYCDEFKMMLERDKCLFIESWGNKLVWIIWSLCNPEIDYTSHIKVASIEDMTKTRFSVPFKANRMVLNNCFRCGGDLRF